MLPCNLTGYYAVHKPILSTGAPLSRALTGTTNSDAGAAGSQKALSAGGGSLVIGGGPWRTGSIGSPQTTGDMVEVRKGSTLVGLQGWGWGGWWWWWRDAKGGVLLLGAMKCGLQTTVEANPVSTSLH
jgi:hypothetical protein